MAHNSFQFNDLESACKGATNTATIETASGKILLTKRGARVMGLFPNAEMHNALWVPQDIAGRLNTDEWNIGGERLWISPERNFYYTDPLNFEGHAVQTQMDPGEYEEIPEKAYENRFSIFDRLHKKRCENCVARRKFAAAKDPLDTGLAFAGVEVDDHMEVGMADFPMSGWSLAQVYTCGAQNPGTALFPIAVGGKILSYFDPIPEERAEAMDGYARFKIDSGLIGKFAIRPEDINWDVRAKAVYVSPYADGNTWFCVAKSSDDMPKSQAECVDPPKVDPEAEKGAIQSYNNGPAGEGNVLPFGEIEIQLSKAQTADEKSVSKARHSLLSWAGSKGEMLDIAKELLKVDSHPTLYSA